MPTYFDQNAPTTIINWQCKIGHVINLASPDELGKIFSLNLISYPGRGRTGAVVSVANYGPRGPLFETWLGRHSLWPWASDIYPLVSTG